MRVGTSQRGNGPAAAWVSLVDSSCRLFVFSGATSTRTAAAAFVCAYEKDKGFTMNGLAHKREASSTAPYFPFHRDEIYPRTLCVNFKQLEVSLVAS